MMMSYFGPGSIAFSMCFRSAGKSVTLQSHSRLRVCAMLFSWLVMRSVKRNRKLTHPFDTGEGSLSRCGTPAAIPLRHALMRVFLATR
jgi:hypothetical protein